MAATTTKRRRAYIGNLRPRPDLVENLHRDLIIPHCLPVKNYPGGDGIIVSQPKNTKSSAYALIEFADVDYAIQVLNGVHFDGKILRVSREKSNFGSSGGGGFGSSRWAGDNGGDGDNNRQHHRRFKNQQTAMVTPFTREGDEEAVIRDVKTIISNELKESTDEVTAAIACTAAMTLLTSVDAFGFDEGQSNSNDGKESNNSISITNTHQQGDMSNDEFQSRCKLPISDLLAEYGEQDVDWKTPQQQQQHNISLSSSSNHSKSSKQHNNNKSHNGMLAHFGKAPIHLEIMSFGYKYNAPNKSTGFSFAHPLPPIDIRDLDRAPGSVSKFNGLSYLVKRALLNPSKGNDDDNDDNGTSSQTQSPMRQRTNKIADEIIKVLVEAINEGGHSAINPLTMTISIGSEYGRHRSVVLVEHLAVVLRARLRRNDGKSFTDSSGVSSCGASKNSNGIVKQLVSVGTRHRDVEAHHRDEEAFGEDLKRQERATEKSKRRQQADEVNWDDGNSW